MQHDLPSFWKKAGTLRTSLILLLGLLTIGAILPLAIQQHGLDSPEPIGAFLNGSLPATTPNGVSQWDVTPAFPNLTFNHPTAFAAEPNSNRLYVAQRDGLIHGFENNPSTNSKNLFLDIQERTAVVWDGGFLGLAFHPQYPDSNYVYTYYSARVANASYPSSSQGSGYPGNFFNIWNRLSRFTVDTLTQLADSSSELIMIQKRLYNGSHRGGGIAFDNDGYLYVSVGDEFRYHVAQIKDTLLEGGVLRLDVDRNPLTSHAPIRKLPIGSNDEWSGVGYYIPNDNPWPDSLGNEFEEYYTVGNRAPHRMTYDPVEDRFWIGEIGGGAREEINVVEKGGNYGWPFREGKVAGPNSPPASLIGTLKEPALDFLRSEANAIIGGYVYRGTEFPQLIGKYLCGGYSQDRIWALTYDETTGQASKEYLCQFSPGDLATFGQDQNGEVYLCGLGTNKVLYKLQAVSTAPEAPLLLSQTGAFADLTSLDPAPGLIPYELNVPFWSDQAEKYRWMAIPNDGSHNTAAERIGYGENGNWDFPIGSVLVKHFELPVDETNPSLTRRLETRFLVHGNDNKYYGITYRWRADNSDADLLLTGREDTLEIATASFNREVVWQYPSREACLNCHNNTVFGVLGPKTRQLNRDMFYPSTSRTANQLTTLEHLNILSPGLDTTQLGNLLTMPDISDLGASLEERARAYLDANCASCHRPGTGNRGLFDARYSIPLESQNLLYGDLNNHFNQTGARVIIPQDLEHSMLYQRLQDVHNDNAMPPLAKNRIDSAGVNLIRDWINSQSQSFVVGGTGLEGKYYNDANFSNLALTRIDPTIDFNWGGGSPDPSMGNNIFSIRWEGQIQPLYSETYTFTTTTDDGVRLWVNNQLIIDKWILQAPTSWTGSIALTAGQKVDIRMDFYENQGGAVAQLEWESPSQAREIVPTNFLFPAGATGTFQAITFDPLADKQTSDPGFNLTASASSGLPVSFSVVSGPATINNHQLTLTGSPGIVTVRASQTGNGTYVTAPEITRSFWVLAPGTGLGTGLLGTYFDNINLSNIAFYRVDTTVNFYWDSRSPEASMDYNTYAVVWEGQVEAPFTETYTFTTNTDDGVRLWVNGVQLIDQWQDQGRSSFSGSIALNAGQKVNIRMDYYENRAYASAQLSWSSPSIAPQIVPKKFLYPAIVPTFPVELLSFTAEPEDGQVQLQWATAQERDADHFEVQRSRDGQHFETLLQTPARGYSEVKVDYQEWDAQPFGGRSYYRLKMVDLNGSYEYSDQVEVFLPSSRIELFPNPVSQGREVFIRYEQVIDSEITLLVQDANGRVMQRQVIVDPLAEQTLRVSLAGLASGLYVLQFLTEEVARSWKVVVQ
jgi:uncharacterized repeat protein (TIGR03806 family)